MKKTMLKQFTLLLSLSLLLTAVVVDASPDANQLAGHRKMLKKRDLFETLFASPTPSPQPNGGGPVNVGQDPNQQGQPSKSAGASETSGPSVTAKSSASAPAASATQQPGGIGGILSGALSQSSASSNSASASSNSASASASSSSAPLSTSSSPPLSTSSAPTPISTQQSVSAAPGVTTITTSEAAESSAPPPKPVTGAVKVARNTIIILVAIGASVAGAAIIWTIIRKWKFRKSSSFEERLQPIDWQPTTNGSGPNDHDITEKLGRTASTRSHGSFTSGNGHTNGAADDLPSHDFTAGPAHLAPVGGYADLQRGPSPQPMDYGYPQQQTQQYYNAPPASYHHQHQGGGYGGY